MWIYGFLKLVPNGLVPSIGRLTIGPELVGGLLFPAAIFGLVTLASWLDRTNRGVSVPWYGYLGMLFVAAYYDTLGLTLLEAWLATLAVPVVSGVGAYRRGPPGGHPSAALRPTPEHPAQPDAHVDGRPFQRAYQRRRTNAHRQSSLDTLPGDQTTTS